MIAPAGINGKLSNDYLQLLPKFAIQYEWKKGNNVYATVSRGYRSGGYNVQMFSDLIQSELKNSMKAAMIANKDFASIANMIEMMMPEEDIEHKSLYHLQTRIFMELRDRFTSHFVGRPFMGRPCCILHGYQRPTDFPVCREWL